MALQRTIRANELVTLLHNGGACLYRAESTFTSLATLMRKKRKFSRAEAAALSASAEAVAVEFRSQAEHMGRCEQELKLAADELAAEAT